YGSSARRLGIIMLFLYYHCCCLCSFFFFNDPATTEIYTLSLHDALPISYRPKRDEAAASRSCDKCPPTKRLTRTAAPDPGPRRCLRRPRCLPTAAPIPR